jgi:hypothetical protein
MDWQVIGPLEHVETIALGAAIRELPRLCKIYGKGHWKKRKSIARIRIGSETRLAELHWYEAHGIGRKELKIKRCFQV